MAFDALTWLTGTATNPEEDITATGNSAYKFVGENTAMVFEARVMGAVTGTSPTLDMVIAAASDAAGTGSVTIATFAQLTATHSNVVGDGTGPARVAGITPDSKGWIRLQKTIGGTSTPTFNDVTVVPIPTGAAVVNSRS